MDDIYVVTNRNLDSSKRKLGKFGPNPSSLGPNHLRLVRVGTSNSVQILDDELSPEDVETLKEKYELSIDSDKTWYASLRVACELFDEACKTERHILLFVHGYNNDMEDVIATARKLQTQYKAIVVPFSWPANGGAPLSGRLAYLSDKWDARVSLVALDRVVCKIAAYHRIFTEGQLEVIRKKVLHLEPNNFARAQSLFTRKMEENCKTTINLMCHSMGNYLLKYAVTSSTSYLRRLVFDNVCLIAADVNNPGHDRWVEEIPVRNRLYVVINEKDFALKWARRKPGPEQKARLGHHLKNLVARNAYYIDVSQSAHVGSAHSYFQGEVPDANAAIRQLFSTMFEGGDAEKALQFDSSANVYRPQE